MVYKQLFQLHLSATVDNISDISSLIGEFSARVVFQLQAGNKKELEEITRFVFLSKPPFEFWIQLNFDSFEKSTDLDAWLNNFTNLLCHLNYVQLANKKLIGYQFGNREGNKIITIIKSYLESQGFENTFFVPAENVIIDEIGFVKLKSENFSPERPYFDSIVESIRNTSYPLQIIYSISDINEATKNLHFFNETLITVLTKTGVNLDLILKVYSQRQEIDDLINRNNDLYSNLITKNTYVDFLKSIIYNAPSNEGGGASDNFNFSETVKIKRFYHYEYEILPLWYKRLGHVIKVLMGKRTLRSLFDDNVTKYRG